MATALPLPFAAPTPGASLLLSHTPAPSQAILICGTGNLATSRSFAALEAGLRPLVLALPFPAESTLEGQAAAGAETETLLTDELRWRASQGQVEVVRPADAAELDALAHASPEAWNALLDRLDLPTADSGADSGDDDAPRLLAVCVTDTLTSGNAGNAAPASSAPATATAAKTPLDLALARAALLAKLCRRRRILLNVADRPQLCDFSFPAAHRFQLSPPTASTSSSADALPGPTSSSLQIAITTNGKGCRLASRIRREIVSALPRNVGDAVETVGWLRSLAKDELRLATSAAASTRSRTAAAVAGEDGQSTPRRRASVVSRPDEGAAAAVGTPRAAAATGASETGYFSRQVDEEDTSFDPRPLNSPVPQLSLRAARASAAADPEQAQRRMRWVSQISEYWPIEYLGSLRSKPEELKELLDTYGGARAPASSSSSSRHIPPLPSSSVAFESPFAAEVGASGETATIQSVHREGVVGNIDEAQDRALRAAHDSMRRRSEAAAIPVAAPIYGGNDEDVEPRGWSEEEQEQRGRSSRPGTRSSPNNMERSRSVHSLSLDLPPSAQRVGRRGHVYLLGSGPGHPGLLTQFAYRLLTSPSTDLILSDKLVPASILALIPRTTQLEIARKFPGNAEAAQSELIEKALQAAKEEGKTVVRLKQGDPFVYGRGGEEVLAFRAARVPCTVVPGISSAFAGPLMLGIAVTQRGAADTFVLCTGVGRGGKSVAVPGYQRSTTLAMLMGVARLTSVVQTLTAPAGDPTGPAAGRRGAAYPPYLPVAIIERASSADQRLVASTLENIVGALERCGEQRPPGMILVGWTVLALEGETGDASILDDGDSLEGAALEARDRARVESWLGGKGYIVREGLDEAYAEAAASFLVNGRG
ncbi:uroporphyrin-III C-methyltransferase [Tilletia horrida]|nr:uroporphyrin-III C-methyltransferase [Tilletia horrida]